MSLKSRVNMLEGRLRGGGKNHRARVRIMTGEELDREILLCWRSMFPEATNKQLLNVMEKTANLEGQELEDFIDSLDGKAQMRQIVRANMA